MRPVMVVSAFSISVCNFSCLPKHKRWISLILSESAEGIRKGETFCPRSQCSLKGRWTLQQYFKKKKNYFKIWPLCVLFILHNFPFKKLLKLLSTRLGCTLDCEIIFADLGIFSNGNFRGHMSTNQYVVLSFPSGLLKSIPPGEI